MQLTITKGCIKLGRTKYYGNTDPLINKLLGDDGPAKKEKIRERLAKKKLGQKKGNTFTPPKYDDVYWEGMATLEEDTP